MDYQGNSKNRREDPDKPPKVVERVVVNEVIVRKHGPWRKFKSLFIEADVRTVVRSVTTDVMIPAAKNMLLAMSQQSLERIFFKDSPSQNRFGPGSRVTYPYNIPPNRGMGGSPLQAHAPRQRLGAGTSRQRDDYILKFRAEAENVLAAMGDIIDQYEIVSVADLNELIGVPATPVDNKWGWTNLSNVQIREIREGFVIDFPPVESIA